MKKDRTAAVLKVLRVRKRLLIWVRRCIYRHRSCRGSIFEGAFWPWGLRGVGLKLVPDETQSKWLFVDAALDDCSTARTIEVFAEVAAENPVSYAAAPANTVQEGESDVDRSEEH